MHRNTREPLAAGRNMSVVFHPHRRQSFSGISKDLDENLDLFSKNRLSLSIPLSDDSSDASRKLGILSVGSVKLAKSGIDELLSSTEGGKHDYDWLLTPPRTPLLSSSNGSESKLTHASPRQSSLVRSSSTNKAMRLSVSQSESNHSSRPTRSSSVTRSSSSTLQNGSYSTNRSLAILNTSSVSVSSNTRPSSPISRSPSLGRPSTPSSRPGPTRSSTPLRIRPSPTSSSVDKTRPIPSSRPSTPSSRAHIPSNMGTSAPKSASRPSTPTRRNSPGTATSSIRSPPNGHSTTASSRPSSPSPRVRPPPQPVVPPDFPLDTPPNLRTSLPDRPVSAGRSRPGAAVTLKENTETRAPLNMARRASSPSETRGRVMNQGDASEPSKASHSPETTARKAVKALKSSSESAGLGRTISKKSLDMAIRHMDIRSSSGNGIRQLSTTTLFPQSIRLATPKTQPITLSNSLVPIKVNSNLRTGNNGHGRELGNHCRGPSENGGDSNIGRFSTKLSELDIYESTRYDAILLKEDAKNTNWLHSVDGRSDTESIFDKGLESLPEPFVLL